VPDELVEELLDEVRATSPGVVELARLASVATIVEPALLRRLRLALAPAIDAGAEGDLWFSPLVSAASSAACTLRPDVAAALRDELRTLPAAGRARQLVAEAHAGHSMLRRLEEDVVWAAMHDDRDAVEAAMRRVLATIRDRPDGAADVLRWFRQARRRMPRLAVEVDSGRRLLALSALYLDRRVPPGIIGSPGFPDGVAHLAPSTPFLDVAVELEAGRIHFGDRGTGDREDEAASIVELPATVPPVVEVRWTDGGGHRLALVVDATPGTSAALPGAGDEVELRSLTGDRHRASLVRRGEVRVGVPSPGPDREVYRRVAEELERLLDDAEVSVRFELGITDLRTRPDVLVLPQVRGEIDVEVANAFQRAGQRARARGGVAGAMVDDGADLASRLLGPVALAAERPGALYELDAATAARVLQAVSLGFHVGALYRPGGVFVSYGPDTYRVAERLMTRLRKAPRVVVSDARSAGVDTDPRAETERLVAESGVVVVLAGPGPMDDLTSLAVRLARERDVPVVPVLTGRARGVRTPGFSAGQYVRVGAATDRELAAVEDAVRQAFPAVAADPDEVFDLRDDVARATFDHVRLMGEYLFSGPVLDFLGGAQDPTWPNPAIAVDGEPRRELDTYVRIHEVGRSFESFADYLRWYTGALAGYAGASARVRRVAQVGFDVSADDLEAVRLAVGQGTLPLKGDLREPDDRVRFDVVLEHAPRLVSALADPVVAAVAARAEARERGRARLTRSQERTIPGDGGAIRALAWSPDGARLAAGGEDGRLLFWDPMSGERLGLAGPGGPAVNAVAWRSDGSVVTGDAGGGVVERDAAGGRETGRFGQEAAVRAVVTAARYVGWGDDAGTVWTTRTRVDNASPLGEDKGAVTAAAMGAVTRGGAVLLAAAWTDGEVTVWDVTSGKVEDRFVAGGTVTSLALAGSATGPWIALSGPELPVMTVHLPDGAPAQLDRLAVAVAWSPAEPVLAILEVAGRLRFVAPDGVDVGRTSLPGDGATCLTWSPDGDYLAVGNGDGSIHVVTYPRSRMPS
jgi:hypothetical protein